MKRQDYQHGPKLDWTEESISGPVVTEEQKKIKAAIRRLIQAIKRRITK